MYYAHNPVDTASVARHWATHIGERAQLNWFLLSDGMFDIAEGGQHPNPAAGSNVHDVPELGDIRKHALWAIPIQGSSGGASVASQLQLWLQHANARPMLSLLGSTLTQAKLVAHLRSWLWAQTATNERVLMRLGDTRSLRHLVQVLTPDQWCGLRQDIAEWLYLDRVASVAALPATLANTPPSAPPLVFSDAQELQLAELTEPDALLSHIAATTPDALSPNLKPAEHYGNATTVLSLARSYGVHAFVDKFSMFSAANISGGKVLTDPVFLNLLQSKAYPSGALGQALLEQNIPALQ